MADLIEVQELSETPPLARPRGKRLIHLVRRGHLYLGLMLFPWAILYGVTSFLFNHPTAFSDVPTASFGASAFVGTPYERRPTANELAEQIVRKLNDVQKPTTPFTLAGEAKFSREFAFGIVKADGNSLSFLVDVKSGSGTFRSSVVTDSANEKTARERPHGNDEPLGQGTRLSPSVRMRKIPARRGTPPSCCRSETPGGGYGREWRATAPAPLHRGQG